MIKNIIHQILLISLFCFNAIISLDEIIIYTNLYKIYDTVSKEDISEATKEKKFTEEAKAELLKIKAKYKDITINLKSIKLLEWYKYIKGEKESLTSNRILDSIYILLGKYIITEEGKNHIQYQVLNLIQEENDKTQVMAVNELLNTLQNPLNKNIVEEIKKHLNEIKAIDKKIKTLREYYDKKFINYIVPEKKSWINILGKYRDIISTFNFILSSKMITALKNHKDATKIINENYSYNTSTLKALYVNALNPVYEFFTFQSSYNELKSIINLWNKEKIDLDQSQRNILLISIAATTMLPFAYINYMIVPFWKKRYQVYYLGKLYSLEGKKINIVKQLHLLINSLYKNNPQLVHKTKEFNSVTSIFNNKKLSSELSTISSFSPGILSYIKRFTFMQTMPGIYVHHYQDNIKNNKILTLLNHFIGSIDILMASHDLLKNDSSICIPEIDFEQKDLYLEVQDLYMPAMEQSVKNSIQFDKNYRIAALVSPIAAGKTVFLSSLLSLFYFQRIGIIPAAKAKYTYFDIIRQKIRENYTLGGGDSKGSSELKAMHEMREEIKTNNYPTICIVDELYSGMNPDDALYYGKKDLNFFSEQKHVLLLVTTHIPKLADYIIEMIKNNKGIKYYYFKIDVNSANNTFKPRYKLKEDTLGEDPDNWYLKNESLRRLYIEAKEIGTI